MLVRKRILIALSSLALLAPALPVRAVAQSDLNLAVYAVPDTVLPGDGASSVTRVVPRGSVFKIINQGNKEVEITDITVNNREECAVLAEPMAWMAPPFLLAIRPEDLSKVDSHIAWFHQQKPFVLALDGKYRAQACQDVVRRYDAKQCQTKQVDLVKSSVILKVGDEMSWSINYNACKHIVMTTITTNLGSAAFQFTPQPSQ